MQRKPYNIVIDFIPKNNPNVGGGNLRKSGDENTTVQIRVHGYTRTLSLFQDIVAQIREQIPDEMFLNKLVEQFLTSSETE
jgi:hypothetical protein